MKINCSPQQKIFCFIQPNNIIHIGYEDEEIKQVKKEDFIKYLFHFCIEKNEGHVGLFGPDDKMIELGYGIQDYELETYGETPILQVVLNHTPQKKPQKESKGKK